MGVSYVSTRNNDMRSNAWCKENNLYMSQLSDKDNMIDVLERKEWKRSYIKVVIWSKGTLEGMRDESAGS